MTIRIWQSYSCNNSSGFRLVAKFSEPTQAAETANEVRAFLAEHAKQVDGGSEALYEGDGNTEAALALAAKYGFAWESMMFWGGGGTEQVGDEPQVAAIDDVLLIYHGYCSGFDAGLRAYLTARGATSADESMAEPELSVLFDFTGPGNVALAKDLELLIAQSGNTDNTTLKTPWEGLEYYGSTVFFRDAGTVGMYFPIAPKDLPAFRAWLAGHDIHKASLVLCQDSDLRLFRLVSRARCRACEGPLRYLDPRIHDIEHPQLQCTPCGGLYELAAFEKRA